MAAVWEDLTALRWLLAAIGKLSGAYGGRLGASGGRLGASGNFSVHAGMLLGASLWIRKLICDCSKKVRVRDSNLGPRSLLYYNKDAVPCYTIIRSEGSLL